MELLQLKYFCDAARSENFSKTAKKFGVPPSDISQSIRRLEGELEVRLFNRKANSIEINEAGFEFYNMVSKGIGLIDDAKALLKNNIKTCKINICINSNRRIVMQTVEAFKREYPDTEVRTTCFSEPDSEDFDVVISSDDIQLLGYKKQKIISENILLAISRKSHLAKSKSIDVKSLFEESFITMTEKSNLYNLTMKICLDYGFKPRITIQSDDPFYVRKCVELGLGIAFVPAFSWEGQFPDSVELRTVDGYTRNTYAYINCRKQISSSALRFFEMIIKACADTVGKTK